MGKEVYSQTLYVEGLASFPHLASVDDNGKFTIDVLVPKDSPAVGVLQNALANIAVDRWSATSYTDYTNPLVDGDEKLAKMPEEKRELYQMYKGHYILKAKTTRKFPLVGPDAQPIDASEVYGGAKVNVGIKFGSYSNKSTGIGGYLQGVQKIGDGEPFGGSETITFKPVIDTGADLPF